VHTVRGAGVDNHAVQAVFFRKKKKHMTANTATVAPKTHRNHATEEVPAGRTIATKPVVPIRAHLLKGAIKHLSLELSLSALNLFLQIVM
jgi:hypothetical protein